MDIWLGYTWTQITTPGDVNSWENVTSGTINGITIFVATSISTTGIMTSYDGENWFLETTPWGDIRGIVAGVPSSGTYADETIFVSVKDSGSSRVLLSNFSTKNSIAIGTNATTGAENCIAIGNGANAPNANTIILGNGTHNIGIGTSNPTTKLDVNGEIQAISFNATSDIRLKKDISNLSNVLENVCKLQGVEYHTLGIFHHRCNNRTKIA